MRSNKILLALLLLAVAVVAAPSFADEAVAGAPAVDTDHGALFTAGEPCNQRTCGAKQFCCNFSCSICAPIGGACTQQVCDEVALSVFDEPEAIEEPAEPQPEPAPEVETVPAGAEPLFEFSTPCNQAVCGPGEFCCNYSCSTCTPKGSYCTQQICPPIS